MDIQIKKNDYVRPKNIRKDVVKKVCDLIIVVLDRKYDFDVDIIGEHPHLYLGECKTDNTRRCFATYESDKCTYDYTQINTCEMNAVFVVLQQNGYYIFIRDNHKYTISKRPFFHVKPADKDVRFTQFID